MRLKVNSAARVAIKGYGKLSVVVREVREAERRYLLTGLTGDVTRGRDLWIADKDLKEIENITELGADMLSWPARITVAVLYAEFHNLRDMHRKSNRGMRSSADEDTWARYQKLMTQAFQKCATMKAASRESKTCKAALDVRNELFLARVIPLDKTLSRSSKRRLRRKQKMRNEGRGGRVSYYLPPEPELKASVASTSRALKAKVNTFRNSSRLTAQPKRTNKKTDNIPF